MDERLMELIYSDEKRIVKKTVSFLSDAIDNSTFKAVQSTAYVLSKHRVCLDTLVEGEIFHIPWLTVTVDNIDKAKNAIRSCIDETDGVFEVIINIKRNNEFGLALVEYIAPMNYFSHR